MALKPYRNPDLCPERSNHQVGPINHAEWVEWADQMAETQEQAMCPGCDLWVIWIPLEHGSYPKASTASRTENVECPTCRGRKRIYEDAADAFGRPCPDCTPPENVDTPT